MKASIIALVSLCASMCASKSIQGCRCREGQLTQYVDHSTIKTWRTNPLCRKMEVIVVRRDNSEVCLDPDSPFFRYLQDMRKRKDERKNPLKKFLKTTVASTSAAESERTESTTATLTPVTFRPQ